MTRIRIFAGSRQQAEYLARWCELPPSEWCYVCSDRELCGAPRGSDMLLFGTWRRNPNMHVVLTHARANNFTVVEIKDR